MIDLLIETKVWSCADASGGRYEIHCMKVVPRAKGGAWIVATNGWCISVTPVEGKCDECVLMPRNAVEGELPLQVAFDGKQWKNNCGRWAKSVDGKFPDAGELFRRLLPDIEGSVGSVRVNPSLVAKIRDAIVDPDMSLGAELLIKGPDSPVGVIQDAGGFGVVMPMARDTPSSSDLVKYVSEFTSLSEEFVDDWQKAHPAPKKKAAPRKKAASRK
jgi:hypothetical protein